MSKLTMIPRASDTHRMWCSLCDHQLGALLIIFLIIIITHSALGSKQINFPSSNVAMISFLPQWTPSGINWTCLMNFGEIKSECVWIHWHRNSCPSQRLAKMLSAKTASRRNLLCELSAAMSVLDLDPSLNGGINTAALFYVLSVALGIFCCSCTPPSLKDERSSLLSSVFATSQ